jgi:sigma-B regulation protein RsbU (phosphoserine phosphatase)
MTVVPRNGARAARLLVVDDNELNRDMLSRRLAKEGHAVAVAADGKQALEMVRSGEFDLVLLDIMMPEMDGFQVLEHLKGDRALSNIPVVMISASEETASVVRCIELGAEDYLPKPFNPVILKARVDASLEKKRLRDREQLYAKSLERELEIGRKIQAGFFPADIPRIDGWEIAVRFYPARQVAGDFYDVFDVGNGRVACVLADVCDKGVGAALFMALFRTLIRAVAGQPRSVFDKPDEILKRAATLTNDYIAGTHGQSNMFATAFLAIVEPGTDRITYINAGHEAPIVLTAAGAVRERLAPTGAALGLMPQLKFEVAEVSLGAGELLLALTDGITEARGADGFFGEERLLSLAGRSWTSALALLNAIDRSVEEHVGGEERSDDITMMALRRG